MTFAAVVVASWALAPQPQGPVAVHEDLAYSEAALQSRRNRLDLYVPRAAAPPPVVMFVHGGSWTGGRKEQFARIGETLAEHGFACAVINTRLFPFAKPDRMVVDCAHALGFLHRHGRDYGYDGDRLFVMGHSSGAHLCSWLAFDDDTFARAEVPKRALRGAVLLSGVYDVRARHFALDGVFGADLALRQAATTWRYAGEGDCPTYLAWAERELPGLSLCARLLGDRLQAAGVPVRRQRYAGHDHADYVFKFGTSRDVATPSIVRFLRDPTRGDERAARPSGSAMLWLAADERERQLGEVVATACAPAGVEVVVRRLQRPDGAAATALFRRLRAERAAASERPLRFAGGFGRGGLAVAASTLTAELDGLGGRVLVGVPLGRRSLRAAGCGDERFAFLDRAPVLLLVGDGDRRELREDAWRRATSLARGGCDVSPVELIGTTAEAALGAVRVGDDLLRPLLETFLK
ncbi:MAG: alpha/beta hydrolase [Planctomycetes bacterium]|nr:alpha/beta hydrolase [Planctomycetota bacterium]